MADLQMKTIRYPGINNLYRFMQPDGTYPDLTAGNIISNDAYNEDTEPYLFRALPYKSKRLEEDLVGATVNWNQLVPNQYSDFVNTVTDTRTAIYFYWRQFGGSFTNIFNYTINSVGEFATIANAPFTGVTQIIHSGVLKNFDFTGAGVVSVISGHKYLFRINFLGVDPTTIGGVSSKDLDIFDLTAMFGSTIADYVYSLEQATAGSGIAWLKSYGFFTEPYYEYDTGTLKSVNPTAHKMVGVNQWDEEWELGYYNPATGQKSDSSTQIRSKNPIPVLPNTEYCITKPVTTFRIVEFDGDGNFIRAFNTGYNTETFVTSTNCRYIAFNSFTSPLYGTNYNNDICINISNTEVNGKYFPYEEHTYDLGNVPLYGLFQLENGQLKAYGDVRHADGGTDRKFALVDLGTLAWNYSEQYTVFYANVSGKKYGVDNFICKYPCGGQGANVADGYSSGGYSESTIYISDPNYTDAAAFKQAMSGVMLYYEKNTTTTEDTPSFEKIQSCFPYGTEEYITTNGVPVGHDTKYYTDVISNIAGIPEPPSGNGTYELKLTVTDGVASYSWVAV